MKSTLPRILIAGTNSGCGKTTLVCAIIQAMINRGLKVSSFKCGPDYIDPMFHSSILDTKCRNLDLSFFDPDTMRYLLADDAQQFDFAIIEGVMGFYDGIDVGTQASSYHVASESSTPVILAINAKGASHSLLATIHGFVSLHKDNHIKGVILNNCSPILYPRLKTLIDEWFQGEVRAVGYMPSMPDCSIESRHLGLVTANEIVDLKQRIHKLAVQAEKSIDLSRILEIARSAVDIEWDIPKLPPKGPTVRIGVAKDRAFCFYYEDNLKLLTQLGAELVPFSPLNDVHLPDNIHGLYLGGGYPELYTDILSNNVTMRHEILCKLKSGIPCIAECGGFLYLQKQLLGREMVGFFEGSGYNKNKLVRFGYVTLTAQSDNLLCEAGEKIHAHEFHYYDVDDPGNTFLAQKSTGKTWDCGYADKRMYAGFPHFHFYASPSIAARFLKACREECLQND